MLTQKEYDAIEAHVVQKIKGHTIDNVAFVKMDDVLDLLLLKYTKKTRPKKKRRTRGQ